MDDRCEKQEQSNILPAVSLSLLIECYLIVLKRHAVITSYDVDIYSTLPVHVLIDIKLVRHTGGFERVLDKS